MGLFYYLTAALYALAVCGFLASLSISHDRLVVAARIALGAAALSHFVTIGNHCIVGRHPLLDTSGVISLTAWLLALGYLVAAFKWRLAVGGALVAPLSLGLLLVSGLTYHSGVLEVQTVAKTLGKVHLTLVSVGVAAFALAATASVLYLLQDSALKSRRLGTIFRRMPPLNTLDSLGRGLTLVGFPTFTLAVLTGFLWMAQLPRRGGLRAEYAISGIIWLIFASLIVARLTVGLRGRRAALLTVIGFAATGAVLLLYAGRRAIG
ncbi:MAG: cytochrome c biogenesis protein CcsA [Deltaproteobacteria bacterium]|nr:cytochrome c biogenesis protein CcsA [Deltaproteobacteria bacterium]